MCNLIAPSYSLLQEINLIPFIYYHILPTSAIFVHILRLLIRFSVEYYVRF